MNAHEQEIIEFLKPYSHGNLTALELLTTSLGRIFNRAAKKGENWRTLCTKAQITHIADWLRVNANRQAPWISNTDEKGRCKKMLKFSDVAGILREADKFMSIENQKNATVKLISGDEEFYDHLADGYYLVRLKSKTALDREGAIMQHCVGHGAYDDGLEIDDYMILSMRDKFGHPHVTIEIDGHTIIQLQGKQNRLPLIDYLKILVDYFTVEKEEAIDIHYALSESDIVVSSANKIVNMKSRLPDNFETKTDLIHFSTSDDRLPRGLIVNGTFFLTNYTITVIDDVNIRGEATFNSMQGLMKIGNNTKFDSHLTVCNCPNLSELPKNMKINGHLLFFDCDALTRLPDGLEVTDTLNLKFSNVTEIPEGTIIGKTLIIENTKIDPYKLPLSLHDDLEIKLDGHVNPIKLGAIRKSFEGTLSMNSQFRT